MGGSIFLFRIAGIDIRMHLTFPLILVWGALQFGWLAGQGLSGALFGVAVTLLLFVIVVLHELGHSFAALSFKIPVRQIVLLPIGGVAQLEQMPESPWQEFVIAIAGPAVNFVLAALFYVVGVALGIPLTDLTSLQLLSNGSFASLFAYVFMSNLFLGLFNLLPAFPMDGGRVLRAALASQLSYTRATSIAVTVGQTLAGLMALWGFLGGDFFIILVAIFIYIGAGQEGQLVQVRSVLRRLRVSQAFSRQVQALSPDDTLQQAVDLTLQSLQSDFPIVRDERLVGLLTGGDLLQALARNRADLPISQVMRTEFPSARPDEDLFEVQQKFAETGAEAMPILQEGRFIGLLTSRDLNEIYRLLSVNPDLAVSRLPVRGDARH